MDHNVSAVVIDFDVNINYAKLTKAMVHLRKPDCLFVVGTPDMKIPVENGMSILGEFMKINSFHCRGRTSNY